MEDNQIENGPESEEIVSEPADERRREPAAKTSRLAVVSFILSLLGMLPILFPLALLGLAGGLISRRGIRKSQGRLRGSGLALAATVIGFAGVIFAAWAIPNYIEFGKRARQTEGRTNLKAIHAAQVEYKARHGTYATTFENLDVTFKRNVSYTLYLADDVYETYHGQSEPLPDSIKVYADDKGFTAAAVTNWATVDTDSTIDAWTINEKGELINVINDRED